MILSMTGMKTRRYYGSTNSNNNSNQNNPFGNNLSIFVSAMKPIRNLHVTYRGQTFHLREGVATVNELTASFERLHNNLGNMGKHISPKGIVWKGQILKPGDDLSKAGIKHGDRIMILPGDKETRAVDILGVYLFLLSSNEKAIEEGIAKFKKEQPEALEAMKETMQSVRDDFNALNEMTPKHVSAVLRGSFDMTYHRLRSWWEHPSLRQGLHDPEKIENYRKVVSTNLSTKFVKKMSSPQLKKLIESPDLWRREFSKIATKVMRFGDTVLEGILDLLLDVLKGRGSSFAAQQRQHQSPPPSSEEGDWNSLGVNSDFTVTNEMKDPSLANNLLFELSESEDDSDLDEI